MPTGKFGRYREAEIEPAQARHLGNRTGGAVLHPDQVFVSVTWLSMWASGIELECGKPYICRHDKMLGKLHITQAALVSWGHVWALSTYWCAVQVKVGSQNPILICKFVRNSLIESISLDLEFDEGEDDIVFELLSTGCKVHLTGYHDKNGNGRDQGVVEKRIVKEGTGTFLKWPR
ncbi:hypothetical protein C5167_048707 [Papaver somniferum]|uniref:Nucleoplasmin-like domain-containing protein n=1 Tax=Papaver somniferum TaxID=3469 RepID=A0A4Y7KK32_PAPSO|nr:hypothetical protein C5167_048707 [Papaver somniferum]